MDPFDLCQNIEILKKRNCQMENAEEF